MDRVQITYHGHACFSLCYQEQTIVIDPYKDDYIPGFAPLKLQAQFVFCSHHHADHDFVQAVDLQPCEKAAFSVSTLVTDHDDQNGALRGKNTIHTFRFGSVRVAHFGDLGRMLHPEELELLCDLDCILIPVGGMYTINAKQAKMLIDCLKPRVIIPMHYRTESFGIENIADLTAFTDLYPQVCYETNSIILTEQCPQQIVVLDPFHLRAEQ